MMPPVDSITMVSSPRSVQDAIPTVSRRSRSPPVVLTGGGAANSNMSMSKQHYPNTLPVPFSSRRRPRRFSPSSQSSSSTTCTTVLNDSASSGFSEVSATSSNSTSSSAAADQEQQHQHPEPLSSLIIKQNNSNSNSSNNNKNKVVMFHTRVKVRKFLPDWADPRVQAYEQQQKHNVRKVKVGSGSSSSSRMSAIDFSSTAELRRLDTCFIKVLRKKQAKDDFFFHEDVWSPRGLEAHIDTEHTHLRRKMRLQSTLVVLLLQARGECAEELARHYQTISQKSHVQAHRQALLDELEAMHSLGSSVLQDLKNHRKDKEWHSSQWRNIMQELELFASSSRSPRAL